MERCPTCGRQWRGVPTHPLAIERLRRGLTLRALQAATGVHASTISRWEHYQEISLKNALKVARYLGIPLEQLSP